VDETNQPHKHYEALPTLVLSRRCIAGLMTARDYFTAAEDAFRAIATGRAAVPAPMHIPCETGGFHAKGARMDDAGRSYVAVKVNANFPGNPRTFGLPTIQGAVVLADAVNGAPLAIMDSVEITLRRTAAATALAATRLARPSAETVAICGCGDQARAQLAALATEFRLKHVLAWDIDQSRATAFAEEMSAHLACPVAPMDDLRTATLRSDMIVTCTTSRTAFLGVADVRPGTFVAAVGADSHDKSEVTPELMAKATVVVDVLEQCAAMGDLHHAIKAGAMTTRDVNAALGELIVGQRPGRRDEEEITIFDSTGTAVQDVAAAIRIYDRARTQRVGHTLSLNK